MIAIRVKSSGSWLDPECSGIIGWKFGRRLWQRVQGQKAVFVTLTYRRGEYADQKDLYHRQRDEQHIPMFIRRLSRALGRSLRGQWVRKMEFQDGGWVHWHLIILGMSRIEHDLLTACWRHGYTWIEKVTKKRVFYMTKYVAKDGKIPFWLYNERPRSVKIVAVSPGFWLDTKPATKSDEPPSMQIDVYVCIGERLRRKGIVISVGNGRRFSRRCEPGRALWLLNMAHKCVGVEDGWAVYDCQLEQLEVIIRQAREWESCYRDWVAAERAESAVAALAKADSGREAALHLRGTSNPDTKRWDHLPWWSLAELEDDAREQWYPEDVGTTIGRWL